MPLCSRLCSRLCRPLWSPTGRPSWLHAALSSSSARHSDLAVLVRQGCPRFSPLQKSLPTGCLKLPALRPHLRASQVSVGPENVRSCCQSPRLLSSRQRAWRALSRMALRVAVSQTRPHLGCNGPSCAACHRPHRLCPRPSVCLLTKAENVPGSVSGSLLPHTVT